MPVSLKPSRKLLEEGCRFRIGPRPAEVIAVRPEGYVVIWEEWTDPKTGVVNDSVHELLNYPRVETENSHGQLVILSRPGVQDADPSYIPRHWRTHKETSRMLVRKACALGAKELMAEERIGMTRQAFEQDAELIIARARTVHARLVQEVLASRPRRGARPALYGEEAVRKPFVFDLTVKNGDPASKGASIYKWFGKLNRFGEDGLYDKLRKCGGKSGHSEELADFVTSVLDDLIDQERQELNSLHDSVKAAINRENKRRVSAELPLPTLSNRVSQAFVRKQAARLGRAALVTRQRGFDQAYKDMHALGVGITTLRALERVEIDEYTIDLTLLLRLTGIFKLLTPAEAKILGLDGKPKRVVISAAIDVHTRCLLALQIVPQGVTGILKQTLEMVYTDKTSISDAAGCKYDWFQHGAPEEVVMDRGGSYISEEAYHILASLGITNLGAPAGKPWLRPFIERVFGTMHKTFLQRFSGRNFSNVVERGGNDPAARATLTLEEFLSWLVRWTVDGYHNRRQEGLGMTPLQAWKNATEDAPVRGLSSSEMRLAFGTRVKRKLGRHGVTINRVNYQGKYLENLWFGPDGDNKHLEVCYWHGDIGTIDVRADTGEWKTILAADERWIGKTEMDVREWLVSRREIDPEAEATRLELVYEMDQRSRSLKAMNGLLARPRDAKGLEQADTYFAQYTDTAERRHLAGPHRDLLADEVEVTGQETGASPLDAADTVGLPADDDLLE